jgi:FKBP-type peptidyl-prolyl cis-trans isomerase SlyD
MSTPLSEGHVGVISFTLKKSGGELLSASQPNQGHPFLYGANNIIPGLEAALSGKVAGDEVSGTLSAADAFGEHSGKEPGRVKRGELPKGRDWQAGMPVHIRASNGETVQLWVTKTQGAWVWVTDNHPLAGIDVEYSATLTMVRKATKSETEHGHPHGIDGHSGHHHG